MLVRLLLCGVLLSLPQAIAQSVSLRLSSANAVAESEVSLDLILTSAGGVRPSSIQWNVEYSTRDFAFSDMKIGPAATAAGKTLTCQGQAGQRSCVLTGLAGGQVNSNQIGDGVVARVVLYVNAGAVLAPSEVRLSGSFAASAVGDAIPVNVTSGTVTIGKPAVGSLSEITCNPTWIVAPGSADCSVVLNGPAPSGGLPVTIQTSDTILSAPSSVTVSAGNTNAVFKVSTGSRPTVQVVTLVAHAASGPQLSVNLTLAPPIQLSSMTCAPQPLAAGGSSVCTVFFKSPTPPPGASIEVRSNSTKVLAPATLNVRSGRSSVRFRADADPLATSQGVRLTSEYRGSSVSTTLSVAGATNPILSVPGDQAVIHGSKLEFRVSAEDPNNLPVTLSVISLPPGAQFNQTGLFQWTPQSFQIGTYTVRFRASTSGGLSALKEVAIRVVQDKPIISALANSASLSSQAPCSPGGLASLLGTGITRNAPASANVLPLPKKLTDVEVKINGNAVPLLFASSTQVNFQCPVLAAGTNLSVVVQSSLGVSEPVSTLVRHASPGIFTLASNGKGQGAVFVVGEPNWAMIRNPAVPSRPGDSDEFVTLYATGLGPVNGTTVEGQPPPEGTLLSAASEVQVLVGGQPAEVQFAGLAPGFVGVFQVNALIPPGLAAGDEIPVLLRVKQPTGTFVQSNQVTIALEDP